MALGDVYELVDVQRMSNQAIYNVYHYEQTAAVVGQSVTSAQLLTEAFRDMVLPNVAGIQTDDIVHVELRGRNLFNAADNFTLAISQPGTVTGAIVGATNDSLPTFNQASFTLPSENGAVRDGHKRIAGMSEGNQTDGVLNANTFSTFQQVADAMELVIKPTALTGVGDLFTPVIVKRVRSGSAGAYQYRLPENVGEKVVATIAEVLFDVLLGHQISRDIGRGI